MLGKKHYPYKLSIITINFNNFLGLKRTVQSVINQNWKEFEYIIIDGGSTDGTEQYISEMKDHFAYCVSEPDKGIYNAMNKGIRVAKGEYLLFLNSGDCLAGTNVLEIVINEIMFSNRNFDTLYIGSTIQSGIELVHEPPKYWSLSYLYKSALPHQGMFIPREICTKIPYNEYYTCASDWLHSFEMLIKGVKYKRLENINIIAINEVFGLSSTDSYHKEKEQIINRYKFIFEGFSEFELNRKKNKQRTRIINDNVLNKFLWYVMNWLFKIRIN